MVGTIHSEKSRFSPLYYFLQNVAKKYGIFGKHRVSSHCRNSTKQGENLDFPLESIELETVP
jgi:hypothetical protein